MEPYITADGEVAFHEQSLGFVKAKPKKIMPFSYRRGSCWRIDVDMNNNVRVSYCPRLGM